MVVDEIHPDDRTRIGSALRRVPRRPLHVMTRNIGSSGPHGSVRWIAQARAAAESTRPGCPCA